MRACDPLHRTDEVLQQVDVVERLRDGDARAGAALAAPRVQAVVLGRSGTTSCTCRRAAVCRSGPRQWLCAWPESTCACGTAAPPRSSRRPSRDAAIIWRTSRSDIAGGFSISTCLPARDALHHRVEMQVIGGQDVDHLDLRVGQHLVQRRVAVGSRTPRRSLPAAPAPRRQTATSSATCATPAAPWRGRARSGPPRAVRIRYGNHS